MKRKLVKPITKPRISVYRSNGYIYAQIIDDVKRITLVSASDLKETGGKRIELAAKVGEKLAKLALSKGIKEVRFDRNGYKYHGRVKALAEGARSGGLIF